MTQLEVTFRGMDASPVWQAAAHKAARDVVPRGLWTAYQLTFEKPAALAASDELWIHLDVQAPGRHVSLTRTRPAGLLAAFSTAEEFVRDTFRGVLRDFGSSCAAERAALAA